MMDGLTIHQLLCFDAVVTEGSFQAAAEKLLRVAADGFVGGEEPGNPAAARPARPQRLSRHA